MVQQYCAQNTFSVLSKVIVQIVVTVYSILVLFKFKPNSNSYNMCRPDWYTVGKKKSKLSKRLKLHMTGKSFKNGTKNKKNTCGLKLTLFTV